MRLRAMITATEGFAALERLVASAESELLICLTDARPETPLVEPRLRERGLQTWSDLIAWCARKDVALRRSSAPRMASAPARCGATSTCGACRAP